ncbi:MAG TPA: spore coat U domain-containing protein [Candidatus Manganitrophaceae bacterium]
MKKRTTLFLILALFLMSARGAVAGTATSNLNVSVNVVPACVVSAAPINFGDYDGSTDGRSSGDISVTCAVNLPYNIALDKGLHLGGPGQVNSRHLADGSGNSIYYDLFREGYSIRWGDLGFGDTYPQGDPLAAGGTGASQTYTVNGFLWVGQFVPTGIYTDTVIVTVHF